MPIFETMCPAKVNLTLHVRGRQASGWHDLESLIVFADVGDQVRLLPNLPLKLVVTGPTATRAGPLAKNLVLTATHHLAALVPGLTLGRFLLDKQLPVAAGLGGGSSDAAGALRLLARLNGLDLNDPRVRAAAQATGADVTVCLDPRPALMRGRGEDIVRVDNIPPLDAVLVNPGVALETRTVFAELGLAPGQAFSGTAHPNLSNLADRVALMAALAGARNDLEPPATRLAPVITEVRAALSTTRASLARLSGSGATMFGIYPSREVAELAAMDIAGRHPAWWVRAVRFTSPSAVP